MLIAQISDSHIELPEPANAGRCENFKQVIADINQLAEKVDLVVHTGDVSHCDRAVEYEFSQSALERLDVPYKVIPGNKDGMKNFAARFGLADGFVNYVVETTNWSLVFLDTRSTQSNKGDFCAERLDWLDTTLKQNNKPAVIFMHHPSFEMADNPYPFQFESQQTADKFENLIADHQRVKGIFCGHAHRTTYGKVAHVDAMTLTAMSLDRRKGTYPDRMDGKPIYQLIALNDDGNFSATIQVCS